MRFSALAGGAVQLVELEGQVGECDVVAVDSPRGLTVVTRHRVARNGLERDYLVFHGSLARLGPSVRLGAKLGALAVVGFVGGEPPGLVLDVRELRTAWTQAPAEPRELESLVLGFAIDPRNVLPLRP